MIVADPGLGFGAEQNPAYRPSGIFLGLPRFALLEAGFFLRAYRPSACLWPVSGLPARPAGDGSRDVSVRVGIIPAFQRSGGGPACWRALTYCLAMEG